jgi:Uncharacterized protein conserved in bacteria
MKPTKEIIGLRIISISDGTQVGIVKDLILNPQGKSLDFIIVDQPTDYFGAKVITFRDILGLGEFAITIPHLGVIRDVAQVVEAQELLKQDIRVLGTKVLTKKGQLIGEVKEILFDEETGKIAACQFESEGEINEIGADRIITLGKELLIVESETITPNTTPIQEIQDEIPAEIQSETQYEIQSETQYEIQDEAQDDTQTEYQALSLDTPLDVVVGTDLPEESETNFNLFEQRQLQYFIGKRADKDVILDNGEVLKAGDIITPECVNNIKTRSTLMEVTSHLQKN